MTTLTQTLSPKPSMSFGAWPLDTTTMVPHSGSLIPFSGVALKPTAGFSANNWPDNGGTFAPARGGTAFLLVFDSKYYFGP